MLRGMTTTDTADHVVDTMRALGDPVRLAIVDHLGTTLLSISFS